MKHNILVKFKPEVTKDRISALKPEILSLFQILTKTEGIHGVKILENCIDRENRYDMMIVIDMDKDALAVYDGSEPHIRWKNEYGHLLEKKAIFDYE